MKTTFLLKYLIILILSLFCIAMTMNAQPFYYYYSHRQNEDSTGIISTIYRFNLASNAIEPFHTDSVYVYKLGWDPTQTWLYFWTDVEPNVGPVMLINTARPNERIALPYDGEVNVYGIFFLPQKQRIYMTTWAKNMVFNSQTLAPIDSFAFETHIFYAPHDFPSEDGSLIYSGLKDTTTGYYYLEGLSTITHNVVWQKRDKDIGYPKEPKVNLGGKKGIALFGYMYPEGVGKKGYYTLYSTAGDSVICNIVDTLITMPYLTGDAKYLILEETPVNPDRSASAPSHLRPGGISILKGITGNLVQKLALPPDGKVLIFDDYPNMLYYYLPNEQRSINIDLSKLVPPSGCNVKLISSTGTKLTGGVLQYYDSSPEGAGWKDAVNNNDGTFFVNTTKTSLSLRMTYDYGTQTKSNVAVGNDTVAFRTVNAQIQLQNSSGVLILAPSGDTGTVQYYAGAWRTFGITINGIASKELLPANYSFRMTYAYASKDKQQDISANPTVIFQTVNAQVQLKNSQGNLIDQGTVQYYSGAWRSLGSTVNGIATKELLPNNYSFRMTYEYASKDKQQDISTNPIVVFQTVNAAVQLQNSQGTLIDQGTVQYYSGAWRSLGTTTNGTVSKELLPNNYSFRMTYEYASIDKQQDITTNNIVGFSTVLCTIRAKNSQNELIDGATASYYSGAWRVIGLTVNGEITKELLPLNLSFRVKYGTKQNDKQQNLSTNSVVEFVIQ